MKPIVFITAGDPLGIGPEITVKALRNPQIQKACRPIVIGESSTLYRAGFSDNLAPLIPLDSYSVLPKIKSPSQAGGLVSFQAVETGIKLSLKTGYPLVTAPISKQSWAMAGIPFTGHTELLRARTGSNGLMMFISGSLHCALVTEHFALSHLPLTQKRIEDTATHFHQALKAHLLVMLLVTVPTVNIVNFIPRSVHQLVVLLGRKFGNGRIERKAEPLAHCRKEWPVPALLFQRLESVDLDRALT